MMKMFQDQVQDHGPIAASRDPWRILGKVKMSLTIQIFHCLVLTMRLSMRGVRVGMRVVMCMSLVVEALGRGDLSSQGEPE